MLSLCQILNARRIFLRTRIWQIWRSWRCKDARCARRCEDKKSSGTKTEEKHARGRTKSGGKAEKKEDCAAKVGKESQRTTGRLGWLKRTRTKGKQREIDKARWRRALPQSTASACLSTAGSSSACVAFAYTRTQLSLNGYSIIVIAIPEQFLPLCTCNIAWTRVPTREKSSVSTMWPTKS